MTRATLMKPNMSLHDFTCSSVCFGVYPCREGATHCGHQALDGEQPTWSKFQTKHLQHLHQLQRSAQTTSGMRTLTHVRTVLIAKSTVGGRRGEIEVERVLQPGNRVVSFVRASGRSEAAWAGERNDPLDQNQDKHSS